MHNHVFYSFICFVLGFVAWFLSFAFPSLSPSLDQGFPIWAITLLLSPVGMILAARALNKKKPYSLMLLIGNIIIFPFVTMFLLTIMEAIGWI